MQDGCRILESGKSGKMAKIYQHHKFPPCLGFPSMGERMRRILHTFSDITRYKFVKAMLWGRINCRGACIAVGGRWQLPLCYFFVKYPVLGLAIETSSLFALYFTAPLRFVQL